MLDDDDDDDGGGGDDDDDDDGGGDLILITIMITMMEISLHPWDHYLHQDSFSNFGVALTRVSVMMTGEEDFTDTFVETIGRNNTNTGEPLNPFPETAFVFALVFVLLMCIVLMNLLVSPSQ